MVTGLTLIIIGILILLYPQLLVLAIAGLFILAGLGIMAVSLQFRRMRRHAPSQMMDFFIRH